MRIIFLAIILFLTACREKLPVVDNFDNMNYKLFNEKSEQINFPEFLKGKIIIMNYIFTNCPDICPLSTNNMRLIQQRIKYEKIQDVYFVSLSFDPQNDTPDVLSKFSDTRNLDLSNWQFLTGKKTDTDSIIKRAGVLAVKSDSTVFKNGRKIYYYIHTDRISLIDKNIRIRKNYTGSTVNINEIISDLKTLASE